MKLAQLHLEPGPRPLRCRRLTQQLAQRRQREADVERLQRALRQGHGEVARELLLQHHLRLLPRPRHGARRKRKVGA